MSKSHYKIPFIGREMLIKCFKKKKKYISFHERNTLVPFCFVNQELEIHQGIGFKSYTYRKKQMGLKLGEFAKTRANASHKGKRLKISKKRQKLKTLFTYDLKSDFFTK
jgi:ribosomal protein S19